MLPPLCNGCYPWYHIAETVKLVITDDFATNINNLIPFMGHPFQWAHNHACSIWEENNCFILYQSFMYYYKYARVIIHELINHIQGTIISLYALDVSCKVTSIAWKLNFRLRVLNLVQKVFLILYIPGRPRSWFEITRIADFLRRLMEDLTSLRCFN